MTASLPSNPENVQKAVIFFTQANLHRLLAKLREKYIEIGRVGGQVILENITPGERREIASFLARPPYADSNLKIKLSDIEKALQHSFNCGVPELLAAF
ncbi:MAG: TIGR02679 domain-containing protein, partial [Ktedonobacteraceae bacterium]